MNNLDHFDRFGHLYPVVAFLGTIITLAILTHFFL